MEIDSRSQNSHFTGRQRRQGGGRKQERYSQPFPRLYNEWDIIGRYISAQRAKDSLAEQQNRFLFVRFLRFFDAVPRRKIPTGFIGQATAESTWVEGKRMLRRSVSTWLHRRGQFFTYLSPDRTHHWEIGTRVRTVDTRSRRILSRKRRGANGRGRLSG